MFSSSIEKYSIPYAHYIGDGDTESFKKNVDSKPYGDDLKPIKLEYVGHVQKCLGTRLRKLRNDMKGKVLSDSKRINGKGRLTDKISNKMQNYFGMASRQNTAAAWNNDRATTFYSMKKRFLQSYGIVLICQVLEIDINPVQGNRIVGGNIGKQSRL